MDSSKRKRISPVGRMEENEKTNSGKRKCSIDNLSNLSTNCEFVVKCGGNLPECFKTKHFKRSGCKL